MVPVLKHSRGLLDMNHLCFDVSFCHSINWYADSGILVSLLCQSREMLIAQTISSKLSDTYCFYGDDALFAHCPYTLLKVATRSIWSYHSFCTPCYSSLASVCPVTQSLACPTHHSCCSSNPFKKTYTHGKNQFPKMTSNHS